ncbi:hypothetical protein E3T55_18935 [Cryobacterium frigoriphilum]|uniref:Uncharacterized protein n=1 Tax=Cryobacterium frigoriphilum TaxID=1259150 RepID=A0A4R8ZTW4_9MICO|nr:hypothetical protein [Cryobacterium frigoriphilum]TFD45347.1 hypothetical protein E3T55_18935 [Cryobacterium frigoriphilum]
MSRPRTTSTSGAHTSARSRAGSARTARGRTTSTAPTHAAPTTHTLAATQQRLDPLGGLAAWLIAPIVASVVIVYAVIATVFQSDETHTPFLGALALLCIAAAAATLLVAARPERAPLSLVATVMIVALGSAAFLLEQASMWGQNLLVQDDFAPISVGLLLLALGPFRPWREILTAALVAAVLVGAVVVLQASTLDAVKPAAVFAVVALTQLLAPALAGAAYSRQMVRSIREWQVESRRATRARTAESRDLIAQSVIDQRIGTLGADVLPFLTSVLERGTVDAADGARAQELAHETRRIFGAHVDSTWLDLVVARERTDLVTRGLTPLLVVADPEALAPDFTAEERVVTAALIGALCARTGFDPGSLVVRLDRDAISIEAGFALSSRSLHRMLRPYRSVLGVVFGRVHVQHRHPLLTITYERHDHTTRH